MSTRLAHNRNMRQRMLPAVAAQFQARLDHAVATQRLGDLDGAKALYKELLRDDPSNFDCLHLLGVCAIQTDEVELGASLLANAIRVNPGVPSVHHNRGSALRRLGRLKEALASYDRALKLRPQYADAHHGRGNVLREQGRMEQALSSYDRALRLAPDATAALWSRVLILSELGRYDEALAGCERLESPESDVAPIHVMRGKLHLLNGMAHDALASLECALRTDPDDVDALLHRGQALAALGRPLDALRDCERVTMLQPESAVGHVTLGKLLNTLGRQEQAVESFDRAISLEPTEPEAWVRSGHALFDLERWDEAKERYGKAFELSPDTPYLLGSLLYIKSRICDWHGFPELVDRLVKQLSQGREVAHPFTSIALTDDPTLQRISSEVWTRRRTVPHPTPSFHVLERPHRKIRIGYYSADLHEHATSYLVAELFELHDPNRFEWYAFSFGPECEGGIRERLSRAFTGFFNVHEKTDLEIAEMSRNLNIDIAIDLKGYTSHERAGIFAAGCAPICVNYLGFPGTMGAPFIDYIIADRTVIPEGYNEYYSEKIVHLPDSYQVNDSRRAATDRQFRRSDVGLPESGFVFCCFNNNYKINPSTFDSWMRMLKAVDGSVLWLYADSPSVIGNLRREAEVRGVDGTRLLFAGRLPFAEHLARYRLADLFIDCWPCTAHTTASDALWMGLPLVTRTGRSFASRVAASLLYAVGMPELVTTSPEEYEATAIQLALDAKRLSALQEKLDRNRLTARLFDAPRFTRNIEAAYEAIWERYRAGLPPEAISVRG